MAMAVLRSPALVEIVAGHLDLEGFAFIKITRSGAQECFGADATSEVLRRDGTTYKAMAELHWKDPAMEKWARVQKGKK